MSRRRWAVAAAIAALLAATGPAAYGAARSEIAAASLPSPADPATVAETARVRGVLEAGFSPDAAERACSVRLLRVEGPTSWAWAFCLSWAADGTLFQGSSMPVRVDGTTVREPQDGAGNTASIEAMFPADLARLVIARDERVVAPEPARPTP